MPFVTRPSLLRSLFLASFAFASLHASQGNAAEIRQWSDATGSFKLEAELVEVDNGVAILKSSQGKTLKVPVAKLSKADQAYIAKAGAENPFQEVEESPFEEVDESEADSGNDKPMASLPTLGELEDDDDPEPSSGKRGQAESTESNRSSGGWGRDLKIDWSEVDILETSFVDEWEFDVSRVGSLEHTPKRVSLKKKVHPGENISIFSTNPRSKKAAIGYIFSDRQAGKSFSRVTMVDLASGRAVGTDPLEGNFAPLAVLDDGVTFVMRANGDWHEEKAEKKNVLQLWRANGRKLQRTKSWKPFVSDRTEFGRTPDLSVRKVVVAPGNRLVIEGDEGQLGCIDAFSRKPYWFAQLSREHSMDLSPDGKLLAVSDMGKVMIVDPIEGTVLASKEIDQTGSINWPAVKWSPNGKKILFTHGNTYEVLDLATGEWLHQGTFPGQPLAMSDVKYPHEDYMLIGGRALVHLPSMIHACDYHDSGIVEVYGDQVLSVNQAPNQGIVYSVKLPHPELSKFIEDSGDDPNLFVIRPGVEVSINANAAGEHAATVTANLTTAAEAAGYKITPSAPLQIVASITGPRQETVNYTREGTKTVSVTDSNLAITLSGKEIWVQKANNMPWFVSRQENESFDAKLAEMSKKPNLSIFEKPNFPKKLQKPAPGDGPQRTNALASVKLMQVAMAKANPKSSAGSKRPAAK